MSRKTIVASTIVVAVIAVMAWQFGPPMLVLLGRQMDPARHYAEGRHAEAAAGYRRAIAVGDASEQTIYNLGTSLLAAVSLVTASEVLAELTELTS